MRILITGGNGYVGREVVRQLLPDHEVCVVDSLRYGALRFTPEELARIRFEEADITDRETMPRVVRSFAPEAIVHLAAVHYIPECEQDPVLAVHTNVVGTVNVLMASPAECRVVVASSGAVYKPALEPHEEARAAVEPSDVYGLSKLHCEGYVRYLAKARGLSAVVVRLFNVVGPGETNPHLLPELVAQLKAGKTRIDLGNLFPRRDYIHVQDAASGFVATIFGPHPAPGETATVNLGTSRAHSVAEIIEKLQSISGIRFEVNQDQTRVRATDRPILAADIRRMRAQFQWRPRRSIDDALADLWRDPDLSESLMAKYR